jgi:hypothetical protein
MPGMSESRKKPGWVFWTVVAIVLTVAYPLSIVPVDWLVKRDLLPKAAINYWVIIFYSSVPVIFMAVCIWLTVRVTNRRERWAKWSLAAMLSMPILYLASWPLMARVSEWLYRHELLPDAVRGVLEIVYYPAGMTVNGNAAPGWLRDAMLWYLGLWSW